MSAAIIYNVLSTEVTTIPIWIKTLLGDHYNNTLCNGCTWMLVLWRIIHVVYIKLVQGYLKQIGTKEYIITRLSSGLWFLGFFSSILAYYLVTLDINKLALLRGSHVTLTENLPAQVILAYTVICTFYVHMALYEGLQGSSLHSFLKFLLLVLVCTSAYILRLLEIPFTLSALIAIPVISEELTKLFYTVLSQNNNLNFVFVRILYIFNLVLSTFIHLIIIPLIFLIPLGKRTVLDSNNTILIILFSSLLLWLGDSVYNSILLNSIFHWMNHTKDKSTQEEENNKHEIHCTGNLIECLLFPMRTDDAYVLQVLRSEVTERKMEMAAKRKPKTRNMIIQTLKCMMAIKKKLRQKHISESSDSDECLETEDGIEDDNTTGNEDVQVNEVFRDGRESKLKREELKNKNEELHKNNDTISNYTNIETISGNESNSESHQHKVAHELGFDDVDKVVVAESGKDNTVTEGIFDNIRDSGNLERDKSYKIACQTEEAIVAKLDTKIEIAENTKHDETSVSLSENNDKADYDIE